MKRAAACRRSSVSSSSHSADDSPESGHHSTRNLPSGGYATARRHGQRCSRAREQHRRSGHDAETGGPNHGVVLPRWPIGDLLREERGA